MAYLVCEKCGGFYELGEGESWDDFESCHCGGNLKYVETLESDEMMQYSTSNFIFHPILTIILGFAVNFLFIMIGGMMGIVAPLREFWFPTSYVMGGFIATYFTKEKKIKYAIIEVVLFSIVSTVVTLSYGYSLNPIGILISVPIVLISGYIGGKIGQRVAFLKNKKLNSEFDGGG